MSRLFVERPEEPLEDLGVLEPAQADDEKADDAEAQPDPDAWPVLQVALRVRLAVDAEGHDAHVRCPPR